MRSFNDVIRRTFLKFTVKCMELLSLFVCCYCCCFLIKKKTHQSSRVHEFTNVYVLFTLNHQLSNCRHKQSIVSGLFIQYIIASWLFGDVISEYLIQLKFMINLTCYSVLYDVVLIAMIYHIHCIPLRFVTSFLYQTNRAVESIIT
jgi:hypothetical protein